MKSRQTRIFIVTIITFFMVFTQTSNLNIFAETKYISKDISYDVPKYLSDNTSKTVTDFVYNNDSLVYTVLTEPFNGTRGTAEVKSRNSNITSANISSTVTNNDRVYDVLSIANYGFYECNNLTSMTIPEGIAVIGSSAFAYCNNLKTISIPKSVSYIGPQAFYNCYDLDSVTILSPNVVIYDDAFYGTYRNTRFYVVNELVRDELIDSGVDSNQITVNYNGNDNDIYSYRVTVESDTGGTASGGGYYRAGDTVYIRATAKSGYEFDRWDVTYGTVTIKDYKSDRTSFTMRSRSVTVTARFNSISDSNNNNSSNTNNGVSNGNTNELLNKKLDDFFKENVTVQNMETGNDIIADLGSKSSVKTDTFNQILGKNINMIFNLSGYKWYINGTDVRTDITSKAYCDLGVNFPKQNDIKISNLVENNDILQFEMVYDGDLPFEGILEFSSDKAISKPVFLYSYNKGLNTVKYEGYTLGDGGGTVKLNIKSSGKYALTTRITKNTYVTQKLFIDTETVVPYFTDTADKIIPLSIRNGNKIEFTAPRTAVYGYKDNAKNFTDTLNHWASSSINFITSRELINGNGNLFEPNSSITKHEFLTALGKLYDIDKNIGDYVTWASQNGILNNIQIGNVNEPITREQMAFILMNYAQFTNVVLPRITSITNFNDNSQINQNARFAVSLMQSAGIINGKDGNNFDPNGLATRAEASVILKRFIENIVNNN